MNLESKRFKVTAVGDGYVDIVNKKTGGTVTLRTGDFPDAATLAKMHEHAFDRACENAGRY